MDARTYELLNVRLETLLKEATLPQLREIRERKNAAWKRAIDEEITRRTSPGPGQPWPFEAPVSPYPVQSSPWNTRPGTLARHYEEEEAIHGDN